ncbi:LysR family transcriptional regulator [Aliigemmobacter aestuarii]|uniref:LysR family transcriptional regulator n=1 Tax=Aliigemmobacter aestuarii TaxID=1445661 RepID=A0A4S3MS08_9RHOB|nr:LysR family transcriptional regulator [Gemmobacter aestuarii]THD84615.1 LysR family transcriptional regulator [Gemmobacter aestuarii]
MAETQGRVTLWAAEVFLAAAEEGAISAAARRLGSSPSAVSQQISGLEAALGAVLIDRAVRPLRLTPAGTMFRRHAQTMLKAEAEARAELALADLSGLTTLRLGMIEDLDGDVTPRLLSGLAGRLAGCRFLLETGPSHRLLDQLEARALDVVVSAELGTEKPGEDQSLEIHPLMADPFVAVWPRGQAGADLPMIRYTARHLMGRQIAAHLARLNLSYPSRFELDSYHALLAMVADGAGWAMLTPLGLQHAGAVADRIEVSPLPFAPLERSIALTARAGVLQDLPARIAVDLRGLLADRVIAPSLARWPFLSSALRLA